MSLHIPFLAHDNFRSNFETWIRQLIIQHKHVAIPLFLPTHRLREQGYPKLSSLLHNHRQCERRWTTSDIDSLVVVENFVPLQNNTLPRQDISPSIWTTSICHHACAFLSTPMLILHISILGHNFSLYVQEPLLAG